MLGEAIPNNNYYVKEIFLLVSKSFNTTMLVFLLVAFSAILTDCVTSTQCPKCGSFNVPYPLSTSQDCGDPNYSVLCEYGKLYFMGMNSSRYPILSINPLTQAFIIKPSPLRRDSCATQDFGSEGILLNESLPFNVTSRTTVLLLNCSPRLLLSPLNCTSESLCHKYVDKVESAKPCKSNNLCCTFLAGGSSSAYRIHIWNRGCRAYRGIVDLDPALPATQWKEGVEIQWATPLEPICKSQADCWPNSFCHKDTRFEWSVSRCFCKSGFGWDHSQGTCTKNLALCHAHGGCHGKQLLIASLTSALMALLFLAVGAIFYRRRRLTSEAQKRLAKQRSQLLSTNSGGKSARIFTEKEIRKATNGFSKSQVLGSGGFGEVYKAVLEDGTVVAVKAAKVGNTKGTEQVLNEVKVLSQVNHKHLVRLLGCCVESETPLMIYEYVSNGTLYEQLHKKPKSLDWKTRLNIARETAEGLAYLHSSAYTPIFHRDVKSSNILLDNKLNAKVSDFGLSRLAEADLTHVTTCAQGTLGYLDPEYYRNYQLTDKSDVYSFGVVLLELVTSKKAIDFSRGPDHVNLVMYVMEKSEQGKLMEVVDPLLLDSPTLPVMHMDTIKAFACLALGCLQEKRQDRPTMREVAEELNYILSMLKSSDTSTSIAMELHSTNTPSKLEEDAFSVPLNWPY